MTNPYFNNTNDLLPTTRARAGAVESNFDAVSAGFDGVKVDMDTKAPINSPALLGTPTAPTPATGDASTRLATMAALAAAINAAAAINLPTPSGDGKVLALQGGAPVWGSWFGVPVTRTSSATLLDRQTCFIDSTAGTFSLTLPASPIAGESWVNVVDIGGSLVTNNVTLLPGANNVMGLSGPFALNTNYIACFLIFTASKGWVFA